MKKIFVSTVLCFMFALGLAFAQSGGASGGASGGVSGGMTTNGGSIADMLSSNPQFSTYVSLLQQAGIYQTLQSGGPYTVFAPTNDAFDNFSQLSALESNPTALAQVLKYSVVSGEHTASSLTSMTSPSLATIEGSDLTVSAVAGAVQSGGAMSGGVSGGMGATPAAGGFTVDNATVQGSAMTASNGLIYAVDMVNIPSDVNLSMSGGVSGGMSGGVSGGVSGGQ